MRRGAARLATGMGAVALMAGAVEVLPTPAGAVVVPTVVTCGQTITADTTLAADVGPCPSPGPGWGINVGADNITLNLNGHRVFGANVPGEGPGVRLFRRVGVVVKSGTVDHFDCGVLVEGGSGNVLTGLTAEDNVGRSPGSVCGDGVAIESSTGNLIEKSVMRRNGPFSGIGLYSLIDDDHPRTTSGVSSGNKIDLNTVYDNLAGRDPNNQPGTTDNDGIRLENNSVSNTITQNFVFHNGLDGISLFAGSGDNQLLYNTVQNNGTRTNARRGTGIIVFARANGNLIQYNYVTGNSDSGIALQSGALGTRVLYNQSFNNVALPPLSGTQADLIDRNGNCNFNQWYGNVYGTGSPDCVKAGGQQHVNNP